jgi:CheY-like chemotaxis protein
VPEWVVGDPSRLRQIILNLLSNALKFTAQGEVVLSATLESQEDSNVTVHFLVRDTGIGIPAEKHAAIFAPFTQVDGSTSRKFGGTGLGLAIVSSLIGLMHGHIWVESEPGAGSRFHFTISFKRGESPGLVALSGAVQPSADQLRGFPVLIVSGCAAARGALKRLVDWRRIPSVAVSDSKEALHALSAAAESGRPFGWALIDAGTEGAGFSLVEEIGERSAWSEMPIVMMVAAGHTGDAVRSRELGLPRVVKPVRRDALWAASLEAFNRTSACSPAPQPGQPSGIPTNTAKVLRGSRILVAEDNSVNQQLVRRLLERRGVEIVLANNGVEALRLLGERNFDLVLMDVEMPEMDGLEAVAAIRKEELRTGAHLPVIALTAHAVKGDAESFIAAGMDAYLSKPIQLPAMLEAIEAQLERHLTS